MPNTPIPVALALGSNLGDRLAALRAALTHLKSYIEITAVSPVYETAAAYVTDQPAFLNAVIAGTTRLEPLPLLWLVKDLERTIGREPTFRYGPRMIDIDLVFYGDTVMTTPELSLPHNKMQERDFVLRPLADAAPHWKHPQNGRTAAEMLALLEGGSMIVLDDVL